MTHIDRLKLIGGSYDAPRCQRGDMLVCELRGREVKVGDWSDAPISWPRSRKGLILCGDLCGAVRTESEIAVAYHWGVGLVTVYKWRKALGVGRVTDGTDRLYREYKPDKLTDEASRRGRVAAASPEAIDRMRQQKLGKPMHPETRKALHAAASRPKSEAWKRKAREWLDRSKFKPKGSIDES